MAEHFVTSLSYVVSRGNFGEFFANYDTSIKFEDCVASRRASAGSMEALLTRNMALAMDEAAAVGRIQQQGRVESGVRDKSAGTCPGL